MDKVIKVTFREKILKSTVSIYFYIKHLKNNYTSIDKVIRVAFREQVLTSTVSIYFYIKHLKFNYSPIL